MRSSAKPRHPGRILRDDFFPRLPEELTQGEIADRLGVTRPRLCDILNEKRGVTPDTALRLSRAFGTAPQFWMQAQAAYDLYHAQRSRPRVNQIERIEPMLEAEAEAAETPDGVEGRGNWIEQLRQGAVTAEEGLERVGEYYEEFLERKGLEKIIPEARRYVRVRTQMEGLDPAAGAATRASRSVRVPGVIRIAAMPQAS